MNEDGVKNLDEKLLSEIVQRLTRIEVRLEEIVDVKKEVKDLKDITDDIKKTIVELQTKDEQQRKELDAIQDNSKWISRAVIGAVNLTAESAFYKFM